MCEHIEEIGKEQIPPRVKAPLQKDEEQNIREDPAETFIRTARCRRRRDES